MNKILQIKKFNSTLDLMLDYLEKTFPVYASDFNLVKGTVSVIKAGNPRLVMENFTNAVLPYKAQILNCDEES